jgi:hypothetical protein
LSSVAVATHPLKLLSSAAVADKVVPLICKVVGLRLSVVGVILSVPVFVMVSVMIEALDTDNEAVKVPVQVKLRIDPTSLFESTTKAF